MRVLTLWVAATLVLSASIASAVPITNGLVAAYEFSGNADDSSGNGNHGVVNGATLTADRFGNIASAYSFDGLDDWIASSDAFNAQPSGSISFWFRDTSASGAGGTFLSSRSASGYQTGDLIIGNEESGDLFRVNYWAGSTWEGFGGLGVDEAQWTHFVFTWDQGDGSAVYMDGSRVASGSPPFALNPPSHQVFAGLALEIGRNECCPGSLAKSYAFGDIDDIYILNRAITEGEVAILYSAVPEPSTALLLGLGLTLLAGRRRGSHRIFKGSVSTLILATCLAPSSSEANLIQNGSFEEPFSEGGWTGNYISQGSSAWLNPLTTDGEYLIGFGSGDSPPPPAAYYSQSFPTNPGEDYVLEFDYGVYGNPVPQSLEVALHGDGLLHESTVSHSSSLGHTSPYQMHAWITVRIEFVADSPATTLTFLDLSDPLVGHSTDSAVDRVSVVPEPSTALLLGLGLTALAVRRGE